MNRDSRGEAEKAGRYVIKKSLLRAPGEEYYYLCRRLSKKQVWRLMHDGTFGQFLQELSALGLLADSARRRAAVEWPKGMAFPTPSDPWLYSEGKGMVTGKQWDRVPNFSTP